MEGHSNRKVLGTPLHLDADTGPGCGATQESPGSILHAHERFILDLLLHDAKSGPLCRANSKPS